MEAEQRSEGNAVFRSSFHLAVNKQRGPQGCFAAVVRWFSIQPPPPLPTPITATQEAVGVRKQRSATALAEN